MQRMLCAHPDVHCAESRAFGRYFDPGNLSLPHISLESYLDILASHYWPPCPSGETGTYFESLHGKLLDAIAGHALQWCGKRVYGEKITPFLGTGLHVIDRLATYAPDLCFIHLVRDGRDVVVSGCVQRANLRVRRGGIEGDCARDMLAAGTIRDDDFRHFTDLWRDSVLAGEAGCERFSHALQVRYEDLVMDPVTALRNVLTLIGVDDSAEITRACVEAGRFERLSGGRRPGEEDRGSFFRKGTPGDWANWFTRPMHEAFLHRIGAARRLLAA